MEFESASCIIEELPMDSPALEGLPQSADVPHVSHADAEAAAGAAAAFQPDGYGAYAQQSAHEGFQQVQLPLQQQQQVPLPPQQQYMQHSAQPIEGVPAAIAYSEPLQQAL